jgi:hypothetical protein
VYDARVANLWHRRFGVLPIALLLSTFSAWSIARAQDSPWSPPGQSSPPITVLRLTDGSMIRGIVVEETEAYVVIENRVLGKLRIPRDHIDAVLDETESEIAVAAQNFDPDYNSVLLGPTAETLPKRAAYFRSFELLILNFGYAPTDNLNLSIGTLFPVTPELGMFSAGFKYRLLSREKHHIGLAAAGTGTVVSESWLATLTGVIGVGNRRHSLNFSINGTFVEEQDPGAFYVVSGDTQVSGSTKLLAEFGNSANRVLDDEDVDGFLNIGIRMFWERTSFTITGFRPLMSDSGDFIAFPIVMFARHW